MSRVRIRRANAIFRACFDRHFFAVAYALVWLKRRRDASIRREARAQSVSFRGGFKAKRINPLGHEFVFHQDMDLIVRGDILEISSTIAPLRFIMGFEYYFRAHETTIHFKCVSARLGGNSDHEWIVIKGGDLGGSNRMLISNNYKLYDAWNALVRAGVTPVGPPPSQRYFPNAHG
jgi:hypothetical protein